MLRVAVEVLAGYGLLSLIASAFVILILRSDWRQWQRKRRVLRAAGKCRYCKFAADLATVALHEAQEHAERSG